MKKINWDKVLNIAIVVSIIIVAAYYLWDKIELNKKCAEYANGLEICKLQTEFFLDEISVREDLVGSELALSKLKQVNNIPTSPDSPLILIFADAASCKPCFESITNSLLEMAKKKSEKITFALVVSSRNLQYAKRFSKDFISEIPVLADDSFYIKDSFNLPEKYVTSILLDNQNRCHQASLFRKGEELLNYKKGEILINMASIL